MIEKLIRPCFVCKTFSPNRREVNFVPIIVPDGWWPMDLYNALLPHWPEILPHESWITSKGRILSTEEAAKFAFESDLLDKKVQRLTVSDYRGEWKP